MRRQVILGVAVAVAAVVVGALYVLVVRDDSGAGYAASAGKACDEARKEIEGLGKPTNLGLDVVLMRVEIGESLVERLEALEPGPGEEKRSRALVFSFRNYYRALRLGYEALRDNEGSALGAIEKAAEKTLADAEAAAEALGATGCTVRPKST